MKRIAEEQHRLNASVRDAWATYAGHREMVTSLLLAEASGPAPTLCVLGAGNCNDLDLSRLAGRFGSIHLCDLDGEALVQGLAAQGLSDRRECRMHGGIDLSGIADRLSGWSPAKPPGMDAVAHCARLADRVVAWSLRPRVNVAASVCLLSQLIDTLIHTVGPTHPGFMPLLTAVRRRHLELLLDLVRPGGSIVLVTDFVSSVTCPELNTIDDASIPRLTWQLIQQRNFFTGLNPMVLRSLFATEPSLASRVSSFQLRHPWRWRYPARAYAVTALVARTKTLQG